MTDKIVTQPEQADAIVDGVTASRVFQNFIDDLVQKLNQSIFGTQVDMTSYPVATLPDVDPNRPGIIFVSDESGGTVMAYSDPVAGVWRRCTDRAVVT